MTTQVLARKWRPHNFATMVGQQHVVKALSNALSQQRLHHAYLFTGTRGVGKTTVARILAKCLNCETGITSEPCEQCHACTAITQGRFVDLYEVDAASRTKVEDTRELLDNVQYAPTSARYKIYLIDEVHMLSGHSFNALLKTLEEPPEHVKFLLATTDPQKLPATVLSRCLQFHMKNLTIEQISGHLDTILNKEGIAFDAKALERLGRAANGSMRDALSLLDQSIAFGDQNVSLEAVNNMLGVMDHSSLSELLTCVIQHDASNLLNTVQQLSEHGADFAQVLEEVLSVLHQTALTQAIPHANSALFEHGELAKTLAPQLSAEQVQLYYQIALIGRRDLPLAPTPKSGFEMVMLRMLAFEPSSQQSSGIHHSASASQPGRSAAPTAASPAAQPAAAATAASANATSGEWGQIIQNLGLKGPSLAVAQHCSLISMDEQAITLNISPKHAPMLNANLEKRLQESLNTYFNTTRKLIVNQSENSGHTVTPAVEQANIAQAKQDSAEQEIRKDDNVKKILESFNATILPDSIESV